MVYCLSKNGYLAEFWSNFRHLIISNLFLGHLLEVLISVSRLRMSQAHNKDQSPCLAKSRIYYLTPLNYSVQIIVYQPLCVE